MTTLHDLMIRTPGLPCRLLPDMFFSDSSRDRDAAVRLCRTCPLLQACASHAIAEEEPHGVWGATTAADRRSFGDGRPWRFDDAGRLRQVCGSVSAYHAHFTYREQPCEACTAAWEQQLLADRRARLEVEHAKGGSSTGYHLHRRIGERACSLCLGAMREQSAAARRRKARRGLQGPRTVSVLPEAAERAPGVPVAVQPASRAA
ncbi:WhiB family transcriptional regulator [Streptomyces tendae]|uniref:WhiB family transcriptional regulator n=1 Tax=Streptomyces tendae TaxID=1932 RepID=UPI003D708DAD